VGKIPKQQNAKLTARYTTLAASAVAFSKVNLEWLKRLASVKLSAEAQKALGEGMTEFTKAVAEIEQTKAVMVP